MSATLARSVLVTLVLACGLPAPLRSAPRFAAPSLSFQAGDPTGVAAADFDHDGNVDVVCSQLNVVSMVFLRGRGDGTFEAQQRYGTSTAAAIALGDFDEDSELDVALAGGPGLMVRKGDGHGGFAVQTAGMGPSGAQGVAVADFNGDGHLDVVTGVRDANLVAVYLGHGDGTFATAATYAAGLGPAYVTTGDVNGDGRPDVVVANSAFGSSEVSLFLTNADGTLQPAIPLAMAGRPQSVALADLNGDGKRDLLSASITTSNISVRLGNGDGTFGPHVEYAGGGAGRALQVIDLDGDGKPDVVTTSNRRVWRFRGNGDGTFQTGRWVGAGQIVLGATAADVNGDGRPDLIAANVNSFSINVMLNDGGDSFGFHLEYPTLAGPGAMVLTDLDGDGRQDLAIASDTAQAVAVLRGAPGGGFLPPVAIADGAVPTSLTIGDVDGDPYPDLATAHYASRSVSLFRGIGGGAFGSPQTFGVGAGPASVAFVRARSYYADADVRGFATADDSAGTLTVWNDFLSPGTPSYRATGTLGAHPQAMLATELDSDGQPDLVVTRSDPASGDIGAVYFLHATIYDFTPFLFFDVDSVSAPPITGGLAVAPLGPSDIGYPSAVMTSNALVSQAAAIVPWLGTGPGALSNVSTGWAPAEVAVGDLTGDGRPDIATLSKEGCAIAVLVQQPDGSFVLENEYGTGDLPTAIAITDVTGDGRPDIVYTNRTYRSVGVLVNTGGGEWLAVDPPAASEGLSLGRVFPNPARGVGVRLQFALAAPQSIRLAIYDLSGRRIRTVRAGEASAGRQEAGWDLRDDRGARVGPGLYFAALEAGGRRATQRIAVTR